ncbi:dual specificity phosphatase catalytic domain protein [Talaromyces proteolyticus]|uniref:Dual specificity phosphatase catalytic domain protein n=1 Tax=Talaromyces proteolyticus TaxID=1131652 RepID=A0AAD4KUS3_9EURO|nr:dual specificity phosphatase catalytic domain protein [Talaromyces proteolyticus]KAH8700366.1 dual specificity phosphatase catalytic domain protein [Talaromyces proteolyticus]
MAAACGLFSRWARKPHPQQGREQRRRKHTAATLVSSGEDTDESSSLRKPVAVDEKEFATVYRRFSPSDEYVDPGLLKKHSDYLSYTTSVTTYPSIRTFFSPHPHMSKLPSKPTPVPMLVFVHGLGGSLAQFHHLLTSLSNVGPCFGIDLPGCGLSKFSPTSWKAYSIEALAELLAVAIEQHRDKDAGQGVILIAHSMGCSLSALLASSTSPVVTALQPQIQGVIAICPKASPPTSKEAALFRKLLCIPTPIFDLWRLWDRRGGIHSKSVTRFVGKDADPDTKQLQVRFNSQSRSAVWRRMAWGTLPTFEGERPIGGMPGQTVWAGIQAPLLLIAGEADTVTKPAEVEKILKFLEDPNTTSITNGDSKNAVIPDAARVQDSKEGVFVDPRAHEEAYGVDTLKSESKDAKSSQGKVVKTRILPDPASHALLYDRATYRTLAGLIQDFLQKHIDHRLSLGWQLQHLNTSGKWDVKNLVKWQKVAPTSSPIADTFIAMKMLRGVDEEHNPVRFSAQWKGKIHAVIDISHENPVYDPNELENGGIHYHKHPTVSKIPPTPDETRDFIGLVDQLEKEISETMKKRVDEATTRPLVGVHCHYGFNRTGFLITSYLIERKGFSVQDAVDEFEKCRPPGIRHAHFIDTLFVRYCVGLKRSTTLE